MHLLRIAAPVIAALLGALLLGAPQAHAADPAFKLVIDTARVVPGATNNVRFYLPLRSGLSYDCTVDWGDGVSEVLTSDLSPTHVYPAAGSYTVAITENTAGGFPTVYFDGRGDCGKVLELSNWGANRWTTLDHAFDGCAAMTITASDAATADTGAVTDFSFAWAGCASLTAFPLLDTHAATSLFYTWSGCAGLTAFPLIDTAAVTDFTAAWDGCSGLTAFPLIDTAQGVAFTGTWSGCSGLTAFPTIDTSAGSFFQRTWYGCSGLYLFPQLDLHNLIDGTACFHGIAMSPVSYTDLLFKLFNQPVHDGVVFDAGTSSLYTQAAAAIHDDLILNHGWVITDAGIFPTLTGRNAVSVETSAAFSYEITGLGNQLAFSCSGLPGWLSYDAASRVVSGTAPATAGQATFSILANDAAHFASASATVTIYVNDAGAPVITSGTLTPQVGVPFSYQLSATHGPTLFTAIGLPSGLVLDTGTGRITGTATFAWDYTVEVTASNAAGTGTARLAAHVIAPVIAPEPAADSDSSGKCGLGGGVALFLLSLTAAGRLRRQRR